MSTMREKSILGSFVPQDYEKSLNDVFYNFLALVLTIVFSFAVWGVYIILQPFFKPLFWALLCGSVLHPFKYLLSSKFKKWVVFMETTPIKLSVLVTALTSPIKLTLDVSIFFGNFFIKHLFAFMGSIIGLLLIGIFYIYTPQSVVHFTVHIFHIGILLFHIIITICENTTVFTSVLLGFVLALQFYWTLQLKTIFKYLSGFVWFMLSCYVSNYFYYIRWPVFFLFQVLCLIGVAYNWRNNAKEVAAYKDKILEDNESEEFHRESTTSEITGGYDDDRVHEIVKSDNTREWNLNRLWQFANDGTSDMYIYWVTIACVITLILKSGWLPYAVIFLLTIYALTNFCAYFGITDFLKKHYDKLTIELKQWCHNREDVILPDPIIGMMRVCSIVKLRMLTIIKESSDSAATVVVILALLVLVSFATTFLAIQAYTEGVYMIKVGGSVINQTVVHNPDLKQLLPENWEQKVDLALNNAYMYGREWLSKLVRKMLVGVNEDKAAELEKRAVELWDRVYQAWMMNALEQKTVGPKVTYSAVSQTWDNFVDSFQKTPELMNMNTVNKLLHANMTTLMSGLESVWELIKGNASLVLHTLTTMLSVVFSHGYAVLNFIINMIVFLTALFYLLSSSRKLYKPVEMACSISPNYGHRLAKAFETAVNEVLTASFKLAVFYGMWTWLIHNIFQMNIVYIPSVFAAILAVIPALGTYWACLPAVLDLWLAQGKSFQAIALACFQFLPTTIVDATIYKEIHGGHPYLTGLSVAGGLFCLGMEGAIIGPLVLCGLYVVVNLSTALVQSEQL